MTFVTGRFPSVTSLLQAASSFRQTDLLMSAPVRYVTLLLLVGSGLGCEAQAPDPTPITDAEYLTSEVWNDGQAEVAFYEVERAYDQYGNVNEQQFIVGTYLVKHRFSPEEMTKKTDGSGVPSFKYALFYELESGSYQYKRNWVVNARQEDLRPYKQSFTSFDWCSNQYRELAFPKGEQIEVRMRSDDYGNRRTSFDRRSQSYPPAQLPLLVRGLAIESADTLHFAVADPDSAAHVSAHARKTGRERIETPAGTFEADRIVVTYERKVPSLIGEQSGLTERYWVGTEEQRRLLKMKAENSRYQLQLVEHLRTPYWKENIWSRLDRVQERP